MRLLLIILVAVCSCANIQSQESSLFEDISYFGDVMVNAYQDKHRVRAKASFEPLMDEYITSEAYLQDNFACLEGCTRVVTSEDDLVTIVSWQIRENEEKHSYGAYIIKEGVATKLQESLSIDHDDQFDILDKDNWYGALYYNIKDYVDSKGNKSYFIFGYNGFNKFDSFKVLDVLHFEENDLMLGKEMFIKNPTGDRKDIMARIKLKYSSDSQVSINYNPGLKTIVYDHLIARMGQLEGQGPTMVPDGSYEGFVIENDEIVYKEKLFDHVYETAPVSNENMKKSKSDLNIVGGKKRKTKR